jgi:predicted nuclease of predicted toxin-antitoxin system
VKFIVDEQMPPAAAVWLAELGHDAIHVRDIGMRSAPDADIWAEANRTGATIVTKDRDFVLRRSHVDGPPVIWVRLGNYRTGEFMRQFRRGWQATAPRLEEPFAILELT